MRSSLLTIIALSYFAIAQAQSNYQKATITTNNSEKLHGWVNYKEWAKSPTVISFKTDPENGEVRKYTVKEISYLEVQDMEYYERFHVSISTDKREPLSELTVGPDNAIIRDTVFLKIIQKGKSVDLYSYRDKIKMHYYIKEHGSEIPTELIYKKYMESGENATVKTIETFKNQLIEVGRKVDDINTSKLLNLLLTTNYDGEDIARVTEMINMGKTQQFPANKPSSTRFYGGIALSSSGARYSGENVLATGADSKTSYFPKLTIGMDFLSNPFIGRFIFRFDLSFTSADYKISKISEVYNTTHAFKQHTGSLTLLAIYNIYHTDPFRLNIGTGISLNLSKYGNSERQIEDLLHPDWTRTEDVKLRSFWIVLPVRIGTVFKKKYEVYAQYNHPLTSITDFLFYDVKVKSWQVGFNYSF